MAIAAAALAIVPPALQRLSDSAAYRDTVRGVLTDLRAARLRALSEGRDTRFTVDVAGRRFGIEHDRPRPVPEGVEMRVVVAAMESAGAQGGSIRFLPLGGATGGSVDVLRRGGGGVRLTVDWLSGAVGQAELQP